MLKISYNKYQWFGSIIFGIIFFFVFLFLIYAVLNIKYNDTAAIFIAPLVTLFLGFVSMSLLIQILYLPFEIFINEFDKTIEVKFLIFGSKTIFINDIESYSSNIVITRSTRYEGVMIELGQHSQDVTQVSWLFHAQY